MSEDWGPKQIAAYAVQRAESVLGSALAVAAMLEIAEERGIGLDDKVIGIMLAGFEPTGEQEIQMLKLSEELNRVLSEFAEQGMRVSEEELQAKIKVMKNR